MDPNFYYNQGAPGGYGPPPGGFPPGGPPPEGPPPGGMFGGPPPGGFPPGGPPPGGDFGGGMPPGGMPFGGMDMPPPEYGASPYGGQPQNNMFENVLMQNSQINVGQDEISGSFIEPETDKMGRSLMAAGYGHYASKKTNHQTSTKTTTKSVSLEKPDNEMPYYLYNLMYHQYFMFFQFRSNQVLNFDLNSALWHKKECQGMYNKEDFRVALIPDYSFLITGGAKNGNVSSESWLYDEGVATKLENMHCFRKDHTTIYNGGYVYVFGGSDITGEIKTTERYCLRSKRWEQLQDLHHARKMATVCNFEGDRIIIAGGFNGKHNKELDSVEILNTRTGRIELQRYALPEALLCSSIVQINPSEVLVMGGFNSKGISNRVHVLNVSSGKFVKRGNLEDPSWSIYQPVFRHGWFYIFRSGRENQGVPDVQYYCLS